LQYKRYGLLLSHVSCRDIGFEISFFTHCIQCADTLIRCINHLVLDSADSSEVPGTIQMHLLICNFSYYLITKESDSETCIFFTSYPSRFPPDIFFKAYYTSDSFIGVLRDGEFWGRENCYNNFQVCCGPILFNFVNHNWHEFN